jgi:hypothetical protein
VVYHALVTAHSANLFSFIAESSMTQAPVWVAGIGGIVAIATAIIAESGRRQSKAANNAVNNIKAGELPLKERVTLLERGITSLTGSALQHSDRLGSIEKSFDDHAETTRDNFSGLSAKIELIANAVIR